MDGYSSFSYLFPALVEGYSAQSLAKRSQWQNNQLTFSLHLYKVSQSQSHCLWVQTAEGFGSGGASDGCTIQLGVISHLRWVLGARQTTHAHHLWQQEKIGKDNSTVYFKSVICPLSELPCDEISDMQEVRKVKKKANVLIVAGSGGGSLYELQRLMSMLK